METQMKEEKTIFIRCSAETNDLLEAIRKADMPPRSRNSQIIYLIHKEAKALGINDQYENMSEQEGKAIYSGLMTSDVRDAYDGSEQQHSWDANGSPIEEEETKAGLGAHARKAKLENR